MALSVDRTYLEGQLAWGEGVTDDYYTISSCKQAQRNATHVWGQNDSRRRLIQICDMERLSLHTQIHRLQRIQSHLLLLRLLWLLRGLPSHVHLLELVGHTLHAWLTWR